MKFCAIFLVIFSLFWVSKTQSLGIIGDVISSGSDIGAGLIESIPNAIPSPSDFFQLGKNAIGGFPLAVVSSLINEFCSAVLAENQVKPLVTPDISKMNFELRTICSSESFPLLHAEQILQSENFDANKKLALLVTGWMTTTNNTDDVDHYAKAFQCRGDTNFLALDASNAIDTLYTWSAFNTEEVGRNVAVGLQRLTEVIPVENIHIIGHSLGAQIVGSAGRHFQQLTGKKLPHITGLDPAKPCFNHGEVLTGILRGDGDFVDILHSDPGILGQEHSSGDVDFWPGGLLPVRKGCLEFACSHLRALDYYVETIVPANERNFLGTLCTSLWHLEQGRCHGKQYPMGYAVPHNISGNYFSTVNAREPYGNNAPKDFVKLSELNCGVCNNQD